MKFNVPAKFNDMTLENMLIELHIPKKELHWLRMSKDIVINDDNQSVKTVVTTGDTVTLPSFSGPSNYTKSNKKAKIV